MTILNGALPPFLPDGGAWAALTRGVVSAGLCSSFGSLAFGSMMLPSAAGPALRAAVRRVTQVSLTAAIAALLLWATLVGGLMAGVQRPLAALAFLPAVLATTTFGHCIVLQWLCLAVSWVLVRHRAGPGWCALPAALALVLQALHSHAFSMSHGPSLLLLSDMLHLLAGGAWLGGLLPLLLVVRSTGTASLEIVTGAVRNFSAAGRICVAVIALTALFQGTVLVGSLPALAGTAYGWMVSLKLSLFGILVGFACLNQFRLAPSLSGPQPAAARHRLVISIALEAAASLGVLLAAGTLGNLPPGMHTPAVWPFTQQFSWVTVREDPDFRREVQLALSGLGLALLLLAASLWLRRYRWVPAALAALLAVLALPHLDLLLIEAYPTSFFHSPSGFSTGSIMQGASLYPGSCATCHGLDGRGDGPLAASLAEPPADLTAPHVRMHSDGEMFWWLTHGIEAPDGRQMAMPGFAAQLDPDQRWALIDFVRARNAGLARAADPDNAKIQAPGLQASCGENVVTLASLRGHLVRLVDADADWRPPADDPAGVVTILLGSPAASLPTRSAATPEQTLCAASDQTILPAYRLVSGQAQALQFLIDANGWLRLALPSPNQDPGRVLQGIAEKPLLPDGSSGMGTMRMDMPM